MKRHSTTKMRKHYDQWQSSGLVKKLYAMQEGIAISTFYYWVSKFEKELNVRPPTKGFQPLGLGLIPSPEVTAIVRYPGGVSVEWRGPADWVHLLKALL